MCAVHVNTMACRHQNVRIVHYCGRNCLKEHEAHIDYINTVHVCQECLVDGGALW